MDVLRSLVRPPVVAVVRLGWLLLPLTVGGLVADALAYRSDTVTAVAATGLWLLWAVVLVGLLVPRPAGLTAVRVAGPAALAVSLVAPAAEVDTALAVLALANAAVVALGPFVFGFGDHLVDGASYGDERRFLLRPPVLTATVLAPAAWLVVVAGVAAGPLLLAARQWVLGGVVLVVGWAAAAVALRALHGLARRWLVFVPAGVVVHDHLSSVDPFLCRRADMVSVGPAPAEAGDLTGDGTFDATARAAGVVHALVLEAPVQVVPSVRRGETTSLVEVRCVYVVPSSGADVVEEAARRRLPVAIP